MSIFEIVPILLGLVAAVAGGALVADAFLEDQPFAGQERRQHPRPPRSRLGEGLIGAGLACVALVLLTGGGWSLATLLMLFAFALEIAGIALSARYLVELTLGPTHRGRAGADFAPARRGLLHRRRLVGSSDGPAPGWPLVGDD